jgi:hypothetical protein
MVAARIGRFLAEDDLGCLEAGAVGAQAPAHYAGARAAIAPVLGKAQVDQPARGKVGGQGHVEEATLAAGRDAGDALHRLGQAPVRADDAQAAGLLGHQHAAVGQEGEAPGVLQAVGDRLDDDLGLLGAHTL